MNYVLDNAGKPIAEPDLLKWAMWVETAQRQVTREEINGSVISTVFLGIDHRFGRDGPPILWETMVFGGRMSGNMDRCAGSREQAEAMHAGMVDKVRSQ